MQVYLIMADGSKKLYKPRFKGLKKAKIDRIVKGLAETVLFKIFTLKGSESYVAEVPMDCASDPEKTIKFFCGCLGKYLPMGELTWKDFDEAEENVRQIFINFKRDFSQRMKRKIDSSLEEYY